jgi:hypothetical protein
MLVVVVVESKLRAVLDLLLVLAVLEAVVTE